VGCKIKLTKGRRDVDTNRAIKRNRPFDKLSGKLFEKNTLQTPEGSRQGEWDNWETRGEKNRKATYSEVKPKAPSHTIKKEERTIEGKSVIFCRRGDFVNESDTIIRSLAKQVGLTFRQRGLRKGAGGKSLWGGTRLSSIGDKGKKD